MELWNDQVSDISPHYKLKREQNDAKRETLKTN